MAEKEFNKLMVRIPELGSNFKVWREDCNISLEQASQLSGMSIEAIEQLESGDKCPCDDLSAYQEFFFAHIPHADELCNNFINEFLAKRGYTYDEEGNEYKDGVRTDLLDEE